MTGKSQVYILKTENRSEGIVKLMGKFHPGNWSGDKIALKANYNSSDDYPASTHIETLRSIVSQLLINETGKIVIFEVMNDR